MKTERMPATGPCSAPSYPLNRMLPSVKPLVTALPAFCLWKPSATASPAALLLLNSWKPWLKVADLLKVAFAFTSRLLALLVPIVAFPSAFSELPGDTAIGALSVTGAVKADGD